MKGKKKLIILGVVIVLVFVLVGAFFFMKYQSYKNVEYLKTYENKSTDNANYIKCFEGVLRYSRDGVALLTNEGEAEWNQPCQMNTPIVEMRGESVAVGDKGGTNIMVFQRNGLKGEIKTTRPIEKFTVSSQGIVGAILKDEEVPKVICYDAKGNILVEHTVSLKTMGYPTDVSLSEEGKTLLVSYLKTQGTEVVSKIAYFYFGNDVENETQHQVYETEFANTVIPVATFVNKSTSILVSDHALTIYSGLKKIKQVARVEIEEEIQGVAYSERMVAMLVKHSMDSTLQLRVYDMSGKQLSSVEVGHESRKMKIVGDQIILVDGQTCSIYMRNGVHKYTGNMEENVEEIYPIGRLNKYIMINASGFHEIELVN